MLERVKTGSRGFLAKALGGNLCVPRGSAGLGRPDIHDGCVVKSGRQEDSSRRGVGCGSSSWRSIGESPKSGPESGQSSTPGFRRKAKGSMCSTTSGSSCPTLGQNWLDPTPNSVPASGAGGCVFRPNLRSLRPIPGSSRFRCIKRNFRKSQISGKAWGWHGEAPLVTQLPARPLSLQRHTRGHHFTTMSAVSLERSFSRQQGSRQ